METSYYHGKFRQGAELFPRCCWFVELVSEEGSSVFAPYLESSNQVIKESKKQWQFKWHGRIEKEFLFETVHPKAIQPFTVLRSQLIFLPLVALRDGIRILQTNELLKNGKLYAAQWLRGVEQAWNAFSIIKGCITENLACEHALSVQNPKKEMVVLCGSYGLQRSAALYTSECKTGNYETNGFVADRETYYYYPECVEEGDYLCAILNSHMMSNHRSNLRSKLLVNKKVFHYLPFEHVSIPPFNANDPNHFALAEKGRECRIALQNSIQEDNGPRKIRSVRQTLRKQLSIIDRMVEPFFD